MNSYEILDALLNFNTVILIFGTLIGFNYFSTFKSDVYNTIAIYFAICLLFDLNAIVFSIFLESFIEKYLFIINHINLLIELLIFGFLFVFQYKFNKKIINVLKVLILFGFFVFLIDIMLFLRGEKISILGIYTSFLISTMSISFMIQILTLKKIPSIRNIYLMMILIVYFSISTIFNITQNIIVNYEINDVNIMYFYISSSLFTVYFFGGLALWLFYFGNLKTSKLKMINKFIRLKQRN